MSHEMKVEYHEGTYVLTCPTCGRVVLVTPQPYAFVVIVKGEQTVQHPVNMGMFLGKL